MDIYHLPRQPTPFIGRQPEIVTLVAKLADPTCRLLTLVGPGGIGKTRLAIEVARQTHFADGIYFVPLQPLRSAPDIVTAIINALSLQISTDVDPLPSLLGYLQARQQLLILDNFEHLLAGVPLVTQILEATLQVKLLVTSRERLNVQPEQVWPITGLTIPETESADLSEQFSALQLFTERAQRMNPRFSLAATYEDVLRICRIVDGVPLAIELAASWTRAMTCSAIADAIQRDIDILTSSQRDVAERHRSMRAVFEHSWHLLTDEERAIFPKLAVFRGGFTAEAAQEVAGASLQKLAYLIDKSLVQLHDNGRYDLHELMRQYAEHQLEIAGKLEATLDHHCEYYTQFMHVRTAALTGQKALEALQGIDQEFDNVRAAWLHAVVQRRDDLIDRALSSMSLFCEMRSRHQDGILLLQQARTMLKDVVDTQSAPVWGHLLVHHTHLQRLVTPHQTSEQIAAYRADVQHALAIARSHNDQWEIAHCLFQLGKMAEAEQNFADALVLLNESLSMFRDLQDSYFMSRVLLPLRYCNGMSGNSARAHDLVVQMVDLARTTGNPFALVDALIQVGGVHLYKEGDFDEAQKVFAEALDLALEMNYRRMIDIIRFHTSMMAVFGGDVDGAMALGEIILMSASRFYSHHTVTGLGHAVLGLARGLQGNYRQALRHSQQSHSILSSNPYWRSFAELGIVMAACGLDDNQTLSEHLQPLLEVVTTIPDVMLTLSSLSCAAVYLAGSKHYEHAVEMLALTYTHPRAPTKWFDRWLLLSQLRADLESNLGGETYAAAWECGQALDLDKTVQEMLAILESARNEQSFDPSQGMNESLTGREYEILRLVATGQTNTEIATALFISAGTVRWHLHNICGKLAANNRTHAVARAREFNLLP
jgi:predicted ATPase/DNA-binding CsgD family transcriptional regulator